MDETYVVLLPTKGKSTIALFESGSSSSYKQISKAVGGMIEPAIIPTIEHTGEYEIVCFVNEEGLLMGLPLNPRLTDFCKTSYGRSLVGDAIFVGVDKEGETVGLNETDAKAIRDYFT